MTKTLTLDEMLDVLELIGDSNARVYASQLEMIGDNMAGSIAARLGVNYGPTLREESAFAGTCATFTPATPGQPCPYPLDMYDSAEWDDEADDTPASDPVSLRIAELEAERDSYVLGHPNGHEEPNPEGWALDNPKDAEELTRLYLSQMGRANV